jgi:hypothetical protein
MDWTALTGPSNSKKHYFHSSKIADFLKASSYFHRRRLMILSSKPRP